MSTIFYKKPDTDKEYCGSVEASKLLGVSVATVHKMVESQMLECWKTVGGHRKISLQSIRNVRAESSMMFSDNTTDLPRLLIIQADKQKQLRINDTVKKSKASVECLILDSAFEALLDISDFKPDVMILDLYNQEIDVLKFLDVVTKNTKFKNILFVILYSVASANLKDKILLPVRSIVLPSPLNMTWFDGFLSGYTKFKNISV